MEKRYTDAELREILGAGLDVSPLIERKIQEAYDEIRGRVAGREDECKRHGREGGVVRRRAAAGFGAAAAVFLFTGLFCAANPSLARELPVVGGILEKLQGWFIYGGMPEEEIVPLAGGQTEEDAPKRSAADGDSAGGNGQETGTDGQDDGFSDSAPRYRAEDQGLAVTLTEYYASNQSVMIGVRVESEEPFPTFASMQDEPHRQILTVWTEESYDFRDAGDERISGGRQIEGRLVDAHTFEGVMRIDYDSIRLDSRKYEQAYAEGEAAAAARGETFEGIEVTEANRDDWFGQYEIPDAFRMELAITGFKGYVEGGDYKVAGRWQFAEPIEIKRSDDGSSLFRIDEANAAGWGLESVEISSGEVTVHIICPPEEAGWAAVLDGNGRPLESGVNADQFGAYGRDLSELTVYVCDFETWTDIKSEAYRAGGESGRMDEALYRQLLEERARYKKVIEIFLGE